MIIKLAFGGLRTLRGLDYLSQDEYGVLRTNYFGVSEKQLKSVTEKMSKFTSRK